MVRRNSRINNFGANVSMLLAKHGMRMVDLARELDIASSTLKGIVSRGRPRESTLYRFAKVFDVDVVDLVKSVTPEEYGMAMIPRME